MTYYITTCITSLSALGGLAFSLFAINKAEKQEKANALYMFARCIGIVFISVIPFFWRSDMFLFILTNSMLIIQIIDGIIGIYLKDCMKTVGPFIMAILHIICLLICF